MNILHSTETEWLALICALVIQLCLILYTLSAGADFGGGILSLFKPKDKALQKLWRQTIDEAIAPIWESNHVWLIVAIVVLFVCFPVGFSWISIGLHGPLLFLLLGISLRGAAFVFAHYDPQGISKTWYQVFMISSTLTPISLGVIAGAIASGQLAEVMHNLMIGEKANQLNYMAVDGSLWWSTWWAPFPIMVGLMTVALFAWLSAIYLNVELVNKTISAQQHNSTEDAETLNNLLALQKVTRIRASFAQLALALSAGTALLVLNDSLAIKRLLWGSYAPWLHLTVGLSAILALWTLWYNQAHLARFFGVMQAIGIVSGWTVSSLPYLLPTHLSLAEAAASPETLWATLLCVVIALTLVLPSLWYLIKIFKQPQLEKTSV